MDIALNQSQQQQLSTQQLQSVRLLQMSTLEVAEYLEELTQENPVVELEEHRPEATPAREDELVSRLRWLDDNDRQNHYYQQVDEDELDPLARVGTAGGLEETLFHFLSRQLDRLNLETDVAQGVQYLAACLDENGYLYTPPDRLAADLGRPLAQVEHWLSVLQSLEPSGVGACSLAECLELQLDRIHETGPALEIVRHHLEALARRQYRAIAAKLGVPVEAVLGAERMIRELEPRPGAPFQQPEQVHYILPDILVEEGPGSSTVRLRGGERPPFRISSYYRQLLRESQDEEVRAYLSGKLRQAEEVLQALEQRGNTLLRCAEVIARRQAAFFREGPQALVPLRLADVAEELNLHPSTVSRAVREKYLQCSQGTYPLSYFFSRSTSQAEKSQMGGTAARALLRRLIDREDKAHPLSDQKLCEAMAANNCPLSRRTVAKYREELGIPGAAGRKKY